MTDLAFASATELAAAIQKREISAVELLKRYLGRVDEYNGELNAIVVDIRDQALAEAVAADQALADGKSVGPLHGVPMTVKESYNLTGTPTTFGNPAWKDNIASEDAEAVEQLMQVVGEKGLMVLDSKTTPNSKLEDAARANSIPVTNRDVFLDNVREEGYILNQLAELERIARANGSAIGIGHPYPQTVRALKQWIPTLAQKGITIVPISQLLSNQQAATQIARN